MGDRRELRHYGLLIDSERGTGPAGHPRALSGGLQRTDAGAFLPVRLTPSQQFN
jgi:hypothetical protein